MISETPVTPIRVLLVEDEPSDQFLVRKQLDRAGARCEFTVADTLAEALRLLDGDRSDYDIILTDLGLPDSWGLKTVHRLVGAARDVPVVVLTGLDDPEAGRHAVQAGAEDFIVKGHLDPIGISQVLWHSIERKAVERIQRAGDRRFHALVEHASDITIVLSARGVVLYISPAVERLFGYKPLTIVGRTAEGYVHPDDLDLMRETLVRQADRPGTHRAREIRFRHADGTWLTLEMVTTNLLADPAVAGLVVNARDVTDRKRAEDVLRRSEERFRTALGTLLDPFVILEPIRDDAARIVDFEFSYANQAALDYNGLTAQRQIGARLLDLLPGHATAGLLDAYCRVTETGEPLVRDGLWYEDTWRGHRSRRAFDLRASRFGDSLAYTWRDVTAREHADAALRALADVGQRFAEHGVDLGALLSTVAEVAASTVGDAAVVWLVSPDREWVRAVASHHRDPRAAQLLRLGPGAGRYRRGEEPPAIQHVLTRRETRLIASVAQAPFRASEPPQHLPYLDRYGMHSLLVAPLVARGEVIGTLGMSRDTPDRPYDDYDRTFLELLADRAALAIANAGLYEQLRVSQERFRSAFEGAPIGVALIGFDVTSPGRILQANQQLHQLLGRRADELVGRSVLDVTHPEDAAVDADLFARLPAVSAEMYSGERRFLRADGAQIWVRVHASPAHTESGHLFAVTHVEDITERKQAREQLTFQALHDPLTGLANRHLLAARLQHALDGLDRTGGAVAVMYIDLDGFKFVNDTMGHDVGDHYLTEIGRRLRSSVRRSDTAARMGGDEFVLACTIQADHDVLRLLDRVTAELSAPMVLNGDQFPASASLGVVVTRSAAHRAQELVQAADLAMYRAKKRGGGRFEIFDEELRTQANERLDMERELRHALGSGLLRVAYQPIVAVADGRIEGMEALVRLQHPSRGLLTPASFLDVAEAAGLIIPIGDWVLDQACRQQIRWQAHRPEPLRMAVNLSGRQVLQPGLCDRVATVIEATGIDPACVILELTEPVFTKASRSFEAGLRTLKERGVRFALDDFGTGYSSLAYLRRFPVDLLKISGTFVAGLGVDPQDDVIVSAVIKLGHTLGLTIVAEGVETERQLDRLGELGCDLAQGFHLYRPQLADAIGAVVSAPGLGNAPRR